MNLCVRGDRRRRASCDSQSRARRGVHGGTLGNGHGLPVELCREQCKHMRGSRLTYSGKSC